MKKEKIAVAMSGGVDSTVTAALVQKEGFEVRGVFMALAQPDLEGHVARARGMAGRLGIPLEVIDLREEFEKRVLSYFRAAYLTGETPNPCVVCNRTVKFGLLLEKALTGGAELMATGHYARNSRDENGVYHLLQGLDPAKDQSYFLCMLSQEQLARVRFPLGELRKDEVYELAANLGFEFARNEESQDVCFLQDRDVGDFLAEGLREGENDGPVITLDGRHVGSHAGIHRFTIGQRRGLGIPDATPWYVVGLEPEGNRVVVGKKEDLQHSRMTVDGINWLAGSVPKLPLELAVKIRYRHRPDKATIAEVGTDSIEVAFAVSQRAITPGQFAAFYRGDELIGGGRIVSRR